MLKWSDGARVRQDRFRGSSANAGANTHRAQSARSGRNARVNAIETAEASPGEEESGEWHESDEYSEEEPLDDEASQSGATPPSASQTQTDLRGSDVMHVQNACVQIEPAQAGSGMYNTTDSAVAEVDTFENQIQSAAAWRNAYRLSPVFCLPPQPTQINQLAQASLSNDAILVDSGAAKPCFNKAKSFEGRTLSEGTSKLIDAGQHPIENRGEGTARILKRTDPPSSALRFIEQEGAVYTPGLSRSIFSEGVHQQSGGSVLRQGDVLWTVMHFKNGEVRVFEGDNTSWLVWPDGSSVKLRKDPADGILDYIEPETATSYDEATSILGRHDIAARLQKTAAAQKSQPVARVATEGKASQKWLNTSPECSSTKLLENLQLIQQQFEAEAAHWHRLNGAANEQTFALVNNIHSQMDELCKRVSDEKDGTGASYRQPAEAKVAARTLDPGLLPIVCAHCELTGDHGAHTCPNTCSECPAFGHGDPCPKRTQPNQYVHALSKMGMASTYVPRDTLGPVEHTDRPVPEATHADIQTAYGSLSFEKAKRRRVRGTDPGTSTSQVTAVHAGEPAEDMSHKRDAVRMCGLAIAEQQLPNVHDKPPSEWLGWLSTQEQTSLATNALLVRDAKRKLMTAQANDQAKPGEKARRLEQYKQAEAGYKNATESATFALISALGELHTDAVVTSATPQE